MPLGVGEGFQDTKRLAGELVASAKSDIDRRRARGSVLPDLKHLWLLHLTKKSSRVMSGIDLRRSFLPLEECER